MPNPTLADRYHKIRERMAAAAARAKREPSEVQLVAVTKTATPEQIRQAVELGQTELAESRVQQLQQRAAQLAESLARQTKGERGEKPRPKPEDVHWHMVGHLQRNKVKPVLQICSVVHSVDSLRLAEEIQAQAVKLEKTVQIMLEVNVADEPQKFGVAVGAATHLGEQIDTMEGVQLVGLMAMAPYSEDPEQARHPFARLREIFEEMRFRKIGGNHFRHLSMGMSGDFEVAIEEGATMVRIGSALFGAAQD
jgi:pyridoxal phosphate enzyme (YggS family)